MTIKAMIAKSGFGDSEIYSGTYQVTHQLATPTASPAAGEYTSEQIVTLSGEVGSTIYYTTNGSTPTIASTVYSSAITIPIDTTITIKALSIKDGYGDSNVYSGVFTTTHPLATPTATPAAGTFVYSAQNIALSGESGSTIYYTTNGDIPSISSSVYSTPITVPIDTTMTIKAIAVKSGFGNSSVYSGTFTITHTLATPIASPAAGTYTSEQTITLSTEEGSTTYYTTNGTDPTISSSVYSESIIVPVDSTITLKAFSVKSGFGDSAVYSGGVYTTTHTLSTPTASPAAGTFTFEQTVTLSAEAGSTIYYTTNGAIPTTGSTLYSGAITIPLDTTTTIKALSVRTNYGASSVYSGTYTVTHTLSTPTASPAAGSYSTVQNVTLSAEAGSTIYYTTNGVDPTTSSSVYSSPISLNATTTLKAISVRSTYATSSVMSALYNINYILTYTAGANGTISGTSSQSVVYNGSGTAVTAVPNTGYSFSAWSDGSTTNPRTDTGVTVNKSLTASFTINSYTFTAVPSLGTLTCNGGACSSSYNYNTSLSMSATSVPGYTVALSSTGTANGCVSTGGGAGVAATCTAVIPAGNTGITATYTPISYTYTFAGNGATTNASPASVTQNYLTSISTPTSPLKTGYTFTGWSPVIYATGGAAGAYYGGGTAASGAANTGDGGGGGAGGSGTPGDGGSGIVIIRYPMD